MNRQPLLLKKVTIGLISFESTTGAEVRPKSRHRKLHSCPRRLKLMYL